MSHYVSVKQLTYYDNTKIDTSFDLAYLLAELKIYEVDWWYGFRDRRCEA